MFHTSSPHFLPKKPPSKVQNTNRRSPESSEGKRSWSSTSNLSKNEPPSSTNAAGWNSVMDLSSPEAESNGKAKAYSGSQSDSFNLRRHSDIGSYDEQRPQKLLIKNVISKTNGASSNTDAEFIIQVSLPKCARSK